MLLSRRLLPLSTLLAAFALRSWQLASIPPGLTHDEAGHGHDAAHVLQGTTPVYFTVGYGREPLFDYLNAGLMAGTGASPFTLRFAAVAWAMIALAATHRAARLALDGRTALLALALMSVSFWPLATGRQALRSAMLPGATALAVVAFLLLLTSKAHGGPGRQGRWLLALALGGLVAAGLYTYIPARVLWMMFPLTIFTFYVPRIAAGGRGPVDPVDVEGAARLTLYVFAAIATAFALASPLFLYLYRHPEVELRIGMLSQPLVAAASGDPSLLMSNARDTLLALFLPGHGDHFLAYNIPGKPLFDPAVGLLAALGFLLLAHQAATRQARPASYLLLWWLVLGLAAPLITGPEAITTRAIGAQPVLYLLPAMALARLVALPRHPRARAIALAGVGLLITGVGLVAGRDYFFTWGRSPHVRAAYQSTLVAMAEAVEGPTVISTVYPSAPHDPYIAELIMRHETRWVDGRSAMLIPASPEFKLMVPASTPLHPSFAALVRPLKTIELRPDDLDPSYTIYGFTGAAPSVGSGPAIEFGGAVQLLGWHWSAQSYRPGEVAELGLVWRVIDPSRAGAPHPPAFKSDLNMFTHVLNPDGSIFLQRDSLDAPSWSWRAGDTIVQIHRMDVPADAAPGRYAVEVGLYDRITGERLPVGESTVTSAFVSPLLVR